MGQGGDGGSNQQSSGHFAPEEQLIFSDEQLERLMLQEFVRENGGGVDPEVEFRRTMAAAFAQAIQEAEEARTAGQSNAALAQRAHEKVLYDFPILTNIEVQALAVTLRSNLAQDKELGFPLSASFVSGVSYLTTPRSAPAELVAPAGANSSAASSLPLASLDVTTDGRVTAGDGTSASATRASLDTIAACMFVKLPAMLLSGAGSDKGAALRKAFAGYHPLSASKFAAGTQNGTSLELSQPQLTIDSPGTGTPELLSSGEDGYQMAEDMDDDDYEFEPLEDEAASIPSSFDPSSLPSSHGFDGSAPREPATWQSLLAGLAELASHARHERLASASVWTDLRLTDDVGSILSGLVSLPADESSDVHGPVTVHVMRQYTALLCEHLIAHPGNGLSENEGVGAAVRALLHATCGAPGGSMGIGPRGSPLRQEARNVALHALATLAVRLDADDLGAIPEGGSKGHGRTRRRGVDGGAPRGAGARALWPALRDALPFLAQSVAASQGPSSLAASQSADVEAAMHSLQFLVKWAPVNADIGGPLLECGVFRDAVQLFAKRGAEPTHELLRRFLLLSTAAAPNLAAFASAVAPFANMVASEPFTSRDTLLGIHGAIWPLVLHASVTVTACAMSDAADASEARTADPLYSLCRLLSEPDTPDSHVITLAVEGMRVYHLLRLLLEVGTTLKRSRNTSKRSLWRAGGPVSRSLALLQTTLRQAPRSRELVSEGTGPSSRAEGSRGGGSNGLKEVGEHGEKECEGLVSVDEEEKVHGVVKGGGEEEKEAAREKVEELLPKLEKIVKQLREHERGDADGKSD